MSKHQRKTKAVAAAGVFPAWLKPLAAPLVISAAIHVTVITTFLAMDVFPGEGGPVAAHVTDDVSTSIQLAPTAPPVVPEPVAEPPQPPEEPMVAETPPEVEPVRAAEIVEQEGAFEAMPAPTPKRPVISVPKSAPAPVVVSKPAPSPPEIASKSEAPMAGFAGVNVRKATRIVYAVDVSGAMAACLDSVLLELRRSIGRLDSEQRFQIVFFRQELNGEQRAVAIDDYGGKASLLGASVENKRRVDQLLRSARPLGRSAPLAGLKRSLEFAPDVVFLLTSNIRRSDQGAGADAKILRALDDLNPISRVSGRRPVVIKTLQFVEDDPTGLMQAIAAAHGDGPGSYVQLKVSEIERPDR
ncbi:MAG: hypothetical protein KF691_03215 [Phycisphaeraceae bacterium]|nr:hypothetical protein [Phycisphaeraceae bacterium]